MSKSKDDFTKGMLMSMAVDVVTAVETAERVQLAASAKEHDVSLAHVTAESI